MTTSAHDADLKGNNFRRTIHPQSCSFDILGVKEGGGGGKRASGAPPVPGGQEKPGLDGANISFMLYSHCHLIS